jgi:hypothetical protein
MHGHAQELSAPYRVGDACLTALNTRASRIKKYPRYLLPLQNLEAVALAPSSEQSAAFWSLVAVPGQRSSS